MRTRFFYESTKNKDARYAVGMDIPDPFFFLDMGLSKYVFLDRREYGVFQEKNKNLSIQAVPLESLLENARKEIDSGTRLQKLALHILTKYHLRELEVPVKFPLLLADYLREQGIKLFPRSSIYPERARKTDEEVGAIRQVVQKTEKAFSFIREILAESQISTNKILWKGEVLTSEIVKREVAVLFAREDIISEEGIIISSGAQSAVPHHGGEGLLLAHEPIVCDIFPRSIESGYCADISRTFSKGEPSKEVQRMHAAVLRAQHAGLEALRPGESASKVYEACADVLREERLEHLFVHAAGHGVGLEVHESPALSAQSEDVLAPGNVVTVEPGVYHSELGGVRIEDMALILEQGKEMLSSHPAQDWIIP